MQSAKCRNCDAFYSRGDSRIARLLPLTREAKQHHSISPTNSNLSNQLELLGVYVYRGSISRIEDCSRTVTDIELFAIAKVLQVDMKELFAI